MQSGTKCYSDSISDIHFGQICKYESSTLRYGTVQYVQYVLYGQYVQYVHYVLYSTYSMYSLHNMYSVYSMCICTIT